MMQSIAHGSLPAFEEISQVPYILLPITNIFFMHRVWPFASCRLERMVDERLRSGEHGDDLAGALIEAGVPPDQ
jgi:hypothetical protein